MRATIDGWMGAGPGRWLASQARQAERIIEVGVWKGRSTRVLADNTPGRVWAVDHWRGIPGSDQHAQLYSEVDTRGPDALFDEFCANLADHLAEGRVIPVRMSSLEAAAALLQEHGAVFDLVFIDADHSLKACAADIAAYGELVAPGGTLAGHDYSGRWPGVRRAVDDAFSGRATIGPGSIWSVRL
jgi:hypothetical protein